MTIKTHTPKDIDGLSKLLSASTCIVPMGARTSTVINYDRLDDFQSYEELNVIDLGCMPQTIEVLPENRVKVTGSVNWETLRAELRGYNLDVAVCPTDQTAHVLAGIATSATGERAFHFGTLRSHVLNISYYDSNGNLNHLDSTKLLATSKKYKSEFDKYKNFKNAPFPRFEYETDLMVGTEGQLGVIASAVLSVVELKESMFIMVPVASWKRSDSVFDYYNWGITKRDKVLSFEFLDADSLKRVDSSLEKGQDFLIFEVLEEEFEDFFVEVLEKFPGLDEDKCLALDSKRFYEIRVAVPRSVYEYISNNQLLKLGTDAQVSPQFFKDMIYTYRDMSAKGIETVLFGHIGDAHLHLNFLPTKDQYEQCQAMLDDFYGKLIELEGSPFAEHGIGTIKKRFITRFYTEEVLKTFKELKSKMDPRGVFFPMGFMGIND